MTVKFKASEVESLLAKTDYQRVDIMDKRQLTDAQRKETYEIENIVSLGTDIITLFDVMIDELGTLPTQTQYVERGVEILKDFLQETKPDMELTELKIDTCIHRLSRTYMSRLVELHLYSIIREHMPQLNIVEFPYLDSVAGIDLVLEDDKKRYYIHVISNNPFAKKMLIEKEDRGGYKVGNTYVPYNRDFTGDLILRFDTFNETDTTKLVNGFPLFKADFIEMRLTLAKTQKQVGELLDEPNSKIQHFKEWAELYLNIKSM